MKRTSAHLPGFTLVEALAAIAVLTILIPVLLQGFTLAAHVAEITRQTADATAMAQSQMDELIATSMWQGANGLGGTQTVGVTDYQWDATLGTWQDDVNVQTLTVTVHWSNRGAPNQVSLVSIVYVPGAATQSSSTLGIGTLGGTP